jgi:hypothetical protein
MIITSGSIVCTVVRNSKDSNGNPYQDTQTHIWNITGRSMPIDSQIQQISGTWSVTQNGSVGSRSWSANAMMVPVSFTARIWSDGLVHLSRSTLPITGGTRTDSAAPPGQPTEHAWKNGINGLIWDPNLTAPSFNNGGWGLYSNSIPYYTYNPPTHFRMLHADGPFIRVGAFKETDVDSNSAYAQPQISVNNTAWWHWEIYF